MILIQLSQLRLMVVSGVFFSVLGPMTAMCSGQATTRTPVLVELFTSEGCSSCPPADALLGKLARLQPVNGAEIIILGEHVTYWNGDGWHDRFSSPDYTDRQTEYSNRLHVKSGIYTPQMIVDGTDQFVGNDGERAASAIASAAQSPKTSLTLTRPSVNGRSVSASVSAAAPFAFKGDLYAALVDPMDTTEVKGGENGGRRLEHAGVVRSMQRIGSLKDLASGPRAFSLNAPADAVPGGMRVVVFAQRSDQGAVVGAVSTAVTP